MERKDETTLLRVIAIFDFRQQGALRRLCSERSGWRGYAEVEVLDQDHAALVMRPGGAVRRCV